MCANCGCGYVSYDDLQTGSPAGKVGGENEATEGGEA